jgi:type III restriction enzyme
MITVANRTETAARVKYAFDRNRIRIDQLSDPERTLHIDSKVLNIAESQADEGDEALDPEESGDDDVPVRKLTKKELAEFLRRQVDTVGRVGELGEKIQSVISVGMLSEGWDAKTVTHIMGLRAFTSQLLCEQVVGRGLRRTSYEVGADGLFVPEYVNIFGVPFTFLPHEGTGDTPPPPPSPKTEIKPDPAKSQFEISWPNVVRVDHTYGHRLTLDLTGVALLELDAGEIREIADLAPIIEGKPDVTKVQTITLEGLAKQFRMQKIVFETAAQVFDQMRPTWTGSREVLLAHIIRIVEQVLSSDKIAITPPLFNEDELRRRLALTLNMSKIVHHIWEAIRFDNTEGIVPIFDTDNPIRRTGQMRTWYTGRPCEPGARSHINNTVYDSTWEATEAFVLDHDTHVAAWVKNDHIGFEIAYTFEGTIRKYRPDFLIRLTNGTMLVLETKGEETEQDKTKRRFLDEWIEAVNRQCGFGKWAGEVSRHVKDVGGLIRSHAT